MTFWLTVACATDMTLFGYDQVSSVCSSIPIYLQLLILLTCGVIVTQDSLDTLTLNGNTSMIETVTALYNIGCFFGAIIAVMVGDLLGRKKTILIGTSIMKRVRPLMGEGGTSGCRGSSRWRCTIY